ncbi:hypothetical protein [Solirubrum puertoriconensis]|uniref:Uncharacterized protein n=1 Tax=Solirubrum puertoriconensis TaxID=1751427 RepID=A0A9X0HIF2_SOLP1|nr:hypothetical protein [Solirubrum puertoriconensis]KUG06483.1 hypothetical protein ASU33_03770 [Solirubrum puertoriconensis]
MLEFIITPHTSAGPVLFGLTRSDIRALFEYEPEQFLRGGEEDTDFYNPLGLFVIYDTDQKCVAVEFTGPAHVSLNGVQLLELSKKEATAFFNTDQELDRDASGYTSYQYGVGAYYEKHKKPETVIVFARGYYD